MQGPSLGGNGYSAKDARQREARRAGPSREDVRGAKRRSAKRTHVRTTDYPVERHFRDIKLCEIGEGSSEVQRMVIARSLGLR